MDLLLTITLSLLLLSLTVSSSPTPAPAVVNDRPVIGILSQEYFETAAHVKPVSRFIVASYVKWIESAGARVVPVMTDQEPEYYERLMHSINGLLFPGGGGRLAYAFNAR